MDEKELEALKESNPKAYEMIVQQRADLEKLKGKDKKDDDDTDKKDKDKKDDDDKDDDKDDLRSKARREKETAEERARETSKIENAVSFNLGVEEFVKTHKDILPGSIGDVLIIAKKERYDSQMDKANALRRAFVEEFFAVQDNVDLLTAAQKRNLDDYLKLTKNGKESRAGEIYETIFEPALETLKKVKKAEELGKSRGGFATPNSMEESYKQRLIKNARKTHLGEKGE